MRKLAKKIDIERTLTFEHRIDANRAKMEDSTTKEFTDVILSLKKETLTMASQCLEIQRELSTILTAITFPKEAEEGNLKKSNENDGFADAERGQIN
jgi:hypothetical protein